MSDNNPNPQNNISFNNPNKSVSGNINLNDGAQNSETLNSGSPYIYLPVSGKSVIFSEKEFKSKITVKMEAALSDSVQEFMAINEKTNLPYITDMKGFMNAQREQRNLLIKVAFPGLADDFENLPLEDVKFLEELIKKADVTGSEKALKTQERNKMLAAKYGESVLKNVPEKGLERLAKSLPKIENMTDEQLAIFVNELSQVQTSPKA